jgi:DNA repair exonuclease SbcCD ATPase subunit
MNTLRDILLLSCLLMLGGIVAYLLYRLHHFLFDEGSGVMDVVMASKGTAEQLDKLSAQITALQEKQAARGANGGDEEDAWMDDLDIPFDSLPENVYADLLDSLQSAEQLFTGLETAGPDELAAWRDAHQVQIQRLIGANAGMRRELERVKDALDNAKATILNMKGSSARQMMMVTQASSLKARNEKLERQLSDHLSEKSHLEREIRIAEKEIELLRNSVTEQDKLLATNSQLMTERNRLENEKVALEASSAQLQSMYERTIREKKFIEEAFVRLESPRELRRLQILREWSHEQIEPIFPRSTRARSAHGARATQGLPFPVGSH